ncbi:MAG: hypothetical protein CSB16_00560 [Clostridiales bacterium]|nr:MAG: hypothetical protein CSB16_00560 [Clostridiales bacterium]
MKNKALIRKTVIIGIPIIIQNIVTSSLHLVDNLMLSHLSENAFASAALANQVSFLLILSVFGLGTGSGVLIAQFYGKKDEKNIRKTISIGVAFAFIIGLLFTVLSVFFPEVILKIFSKDSDVITKGTSYLRISAICFIPIAITYIFTAASRSIGNSKISMYSSIIAVVLNVILNWLLIFGNMGFPKLGIVGAAIATVISRFFELIFILVIIKKLKLSILVKVRDFFDVSKQLLKRYISISLPVVTNEFMWALGHVIFVFAVSRLGTSFVSAYNAVGIVVNVIINLGFGMSLALATVIGNLIGEGRQREAKEISVQFFVYSTVATIFISLGIVFLADTIAGIFEFSVATYELMKKMLYIMSVMIIFYNFNTIYVVGISRGGGDTKATMYIEILTIWLIGVPLSLLGSYMGVSPIWLYLIISFEEFIKAFICLYRFKSDKWINNVVSDIV